MKTILYYLAVAALFTHELDAVLNQEWRLLFHLFALPESIESTLFIALHFPLFFMFFYLGHHHDERVAHRFRVIVCAFSVIHGVLHGSLSHHDLYFFEGLVSHAYIYGSSVFGLAFLWVARKQRQA